LAVLALGAAIARPGAALGPAGILTIVATTIGMQRAEMTRRLYDLWARLARMYAGSARLVVAWISYQAVLLASRGSGRSLRLRQPSAGESMWTAVDPPAARSSGRGTSAEPGSPSKGGVGGFVRWNISTRRFWALPLVPFLLLLRVLSEREKGYAGSPSREIYTLY
jgi:hypothetical protein